jgi:hypothetical protein
LPQNPDEMTFGGCLRELLFVVGARPGGSPDKPGKPWSIKDFAYAAGKVTPTTIYNWLKNEKLPDNTITIERELFGNSKNYEDWRRILRTALIKGRDRRKAKKETKNEGGSSPFETLNSLKLSGVHNSEISTEQPAEKTFGLELSEQHLNNYDSNHERNLAEQDSLLLGVKIAPPAVQFLRGAETDSWAVIKDVAVPRLRYEDRLIKAITESRLCVVTGAAGDGKSTICRRVALRLKSSGWRIFYATAPDDIEGDLEGYSFGNRRTVLFIDNAEYLSSIGKIGALMKANTEVRVVLVSRHYQIFEKLQQLQHLNPREIVISSCEAEIVHELARTITIHQAGLNEDQEALAERLQSLVEGQTNHFLAIMLSATQGETFEEIIRSMIRQFRSQDDEWILKSIAIGMLLADLGDDIDLLIDARLLTRLENSRSRSLTSSKSRSALERAKCEVVRNPTLSKPSDRRKLVLRHPDVMRTVLKEFYDFEVGSSIGHVEFFEDDLLDVCRSLALDAATGAAGSIEPVKDYTAAAIDCLSRASLEGEWFPPSILASIAVDCAAVWGSSEDDRKYSRRYISIALERCLSMNVPDIPSIHRLGSKLIELGGDGGSAYQNWFRFEMKRRNYGAANVPFSGRWLAHRNLLSAEEISHNLITVWQQFEREIDQNATIEQECSWRWIGRTYFERTSKLDPNVVATWLALEFEAGNEGTTDIEYSGRWIGRTYFERTSKLDPNVVATWLALEFKADNEGATDIEYSGRWIGRTCFERTSKLDPNVVARWLALEFEAGNEGTTDIEYSGRWIGRTFFERTSKLDPIVVATWLALEFEAGNEGTTELEYTGRWIGKRYIGSTQRLDPSFVATWLSREFQAGNAGAPDLEYSGRWLGHAFFSRGGELDSTVAPAWMKAELEYPSQEVGSRESAAMSVARLAWEKGSRNQAFLQKFIRFGAASQGLGNACTPWSPAWIFWECWNTDVRPLGLMTEILSCELLGDRNEFLAIASAIRDFVGEQRYVALAETSRSYLYGKASFEADT